MEPEEVKSKDGVIRRNLDRIRISAATPLPPNPSRFSQVRLTVSHWNRQDWAVSLSTLLTGKALQVNTSMPSENAHDYDRLKVALLKRYKLTEEGYHWRFREIKPDEGETVFQFMTRLRLCFSEWTLMAKCEHSFEELTDLLVHEQFLSVCSTEMARS